MDVVLIFNGSIKDKELETRLKKATSTISDLLETECIMKKVEPWNSVRVTFNVPRDAANRLKQLAQRNNEQLKRLGILSIQVEGEDIVRLSICHSGGNIQQVFIRQQTTPLPRGKVVVDQGSLSSSPHDRIQGNGPHELDTILNQLTSGQIQPRLTTQNSSAFSGAAFIVPKQQKKRNRKSKDKTSLHQNQKPNDAIQSNSVNVNGPLNAHSTMNTNSQVGIATRTSADQSDNLPLSEIPELDLTELIGTDDGGGGPLDLENLGEDKSQYMSQSYVEEMVTDMWQNNSMNQEVHMATSLSMSTSSLTTNQAQTQIADTSSNNIQHQIPDTSLIEKDSNSNEVDDLLNLQLNSFESEDGSSILNSNISDIPYSQDAFASISGPSPITTHVIHRQMSFPQYSSKPGTPLGVNSQGMFTQSSGRQSVGPINTATIMSSPHHAQQLMQSSPMGPGDPNLQAMGMHQVNQKATVQQQMQMTGKMFHGSHMVEKTEMPVGNRVIAGFGGPTGQNHMDVMGMNNMHTVRQGQNMPVQLPCTGWNHGKVGNNTASGIMPNQLDYKMSQQQHMPHNALLHPSTMSHKPGMQVGSYTSSSVVTKRGYSSLSGSHYPQNHPLQGMNQVPAGLEDKLHQGQQQQGMSMASPLLVTLLQTESSCSTTGTSTSAGQTMSAAMVHSAPSSTIEPPKPKRKKTPRRKKAKTAYTPPISDSTMSSMIVGQSGMMPGQMAQMSPQHGPNPRLQPAGFNANVGFTMQQASSPGQYYHPRGQSPVMHQGMGDGPKGMYGHFPNGNNLSPGLHPMGKASPNHMFSPDQKTAYIETINRSDVGSRLANTPSQINQPPISGVKPQIHPNMSPGHNLMTPNHMPASSMNTSTFMGSGSASGTIHHGARMMGHNGMPSPQMQSRMQMSPGVRMQPQGHMAQHMGAGNNLRLGGPSPSPGMQMMGQQYPIHHQQQQQYPPQQTSQNISPFQSPPNLQPNSLTTYNPSKQKQQQHNMLISPQSAIMTGELVQDGNMIPPNVVINGSDNLQQAMAVHRSVPGHQKRVGADLTGMLPNDLTMQNTAMYYQQQSSNSPSALMGSNPMKIPGNPNAAYYHGGMAMAGPNNFNNSSNNSGQSVNPQIPGNGDLLPTLSTPLCVKPEETASVAVTHYATSGRSTLGVLSTGEASILLKGPCTLPSIAKSPGSVKSSFSDTQPVELSGQKSRQCRKSPGSATDGHSSSPGSGHSYPSPATIKKSITPVGTPQTSSASNPLTPSHEPLGSPTSSSIHSGSRSTTPKPRSRCTTPRSGCATPISNPGSNRRLSVERQQHGSYPTHSQSRHAGASTPNSAPVNGPAQLPRPTSRSDQQQFMSPPGSQVHQQYPSQNPPPYFSFSPHPPLRPQCSSNTSPLPTNPCQVGYNTQSYGYPPPLASTHNREHQNAYQNPFHQQKPIPAKSTAHMGPMPHWVGATVPNHHASPNQINMLPNYEPQHDINQMQSQQPPPMHFNPQPPNSLLLHHSTNHSLDLNQGRSDSANHFNNAYPSDSTQSEFVLGQGKDPGVTALCTKPSPHFFNSQNQDLLNSGKQQQQETSVPLHS